MTTTNFKDRNNIEELKVKNALVKSIEKDNPNSKHTNISLAHTMLPKIPRIVGVSGRTYEEVKHLIRTIELNHHDEQFLSSINNAHYDPIKKSHQHRGYALLGETVHKEYFFAKNLDRLKMVFIYPGLGMELGVTVRSLMKMDLFKQSIMKSASYLKPYGVNLIDLITNGFTDDFNNMVSSFVTLTSIQVALTDILKCVGIQPDIIFGHSLGEICCGYADGALTSKQVVLVAYELAKSFMDTRNTPAKMAAVSLPADIIERRCPPNVYTVCYNSIDKTTIAGEPGNVEKFVKELQNENIFAKILPTFGCAFHCKYVDASKQLIMERLKKVIPFPKKRSHKWLSTSNPERDWHLPVAKTCSAEYYCKNACDKTYFYQTFEHLPENIVTLEICPTGTLQFIIKSNLAPNVPHISLIKKGKGNGNALETFFCSLGRIYNVGATARLENIYNPMAQQSKEEHKIKAVHKVKFNQTIQEKDLTNSGILYPAVGYLVLVWQLFAGLKNQYLEYSDIVIKDVQFHTVPILTKSFTVRTEINKETGKFKILEEQLLIATGKVLAVQSSNYVPSITNKSLDNIFNEHSRKFPTSFELYDYKLDFQYDLTDCTDEYLENFNSNKEYTVQWNNNWIVLIDLMIQRFLWYKQRYILFPKNIEKFYFNPEKVLKTVNKSMGNETISVRQCGQSIQAPGIEITGLKFWLLEDLRKQNRHKL